VGYQRVAAKGSTGRFGPHGQGGCWLQASRLSLRTDTRSIQQMGTGALDSTEEVVMRRLLPFLVLAMFLLPFTAAASDLCIPGSGYLANGQTVVTPYLASNIWVGTLNASIDCVTPTWVYCVGLGAWLCYPATYPQATDITSHEVVWILNNYYPAVPGMPAELLNDNDRATAVQLALWHFTDGFDISIGEPLAVFDAARAIVAAALTANVPPTPTSLVLAPAYFPPPPTGSPVMVTATLYDQNGNLMPNVPITWTLGYPLSSGGGVTNENGQFAVSWTWLGCGILNFNVDYTIPIGLHWLLPGCQELIQGKTESGHLSASWGDNPSDTAPATWGNIKTMYR
jgi:TQXA domain-containing protein